MRRRRKRESRERERTRHERVVALDVADDRHLDLVLLVVALAADDDVALGAVEQLRDALVVVGVDDAREGRVVEERRRRLAGRGGREGGERALHGGDELGLHRRGREDVVGRDADLCGGRGREGVSASATNTAESTRERRVGRTWPALTNLAQMILLATTSTLASSRTTAGLLPPSSSVTGVRCSAAALATMRPTPPEPV